jgi:hypothetical protein
MRNRARFLQVFVMSLFGLFSSPRDAYPMSPDQMQKLAGAALLDLRVDALFRQCGLPSAIIDSGGLSQPRQAVRWNDAEMSLSAMNWEIRYSREREAVTTKSDWSNREPGNVACLSGLSALILHTQGGAGTLTVTKRADHHGYRTSYLVPDNAYAAHRVIGITGKWDRDRPIEQIQRLYGTPDAVVKKEDGTRIYRYWIVEQRKRTPVSVHAVDFEIKGTEKTCRSYSVYTTGVDFVQEKFDDLAREWERANVLD